MNCKACGGQGKSPVPMPVAGKSVMVVKMDCPTCKGTGKTK